jgi:hypothetical protein
MPLVTVTGDVGVSPTSLVISKLRGASGPANSLPFFDSDQSFVGQVGVVTVAFDVGMGNIISYR